MLVNKEVTGPQCYRIWDESRNVSHQLHEASLVTVWCAFFWTRSESWHVRNVPSKECKIITNKSKNQVGSDGLKLDFCSPNDALWVLLKKKTRRIVINLLRVLSPNTFSNISKWCCFFLAALNCNTGVQPNLWRHCVSNRAEQKTTSSDNPASEKFPCWE